MEKKSDFSKKKMPKTKSAAIRYHLIDAALHNSHRRWPFEELLEHIADQLAEHRIADGISKRTLEGDITAMRASPPIGYGAPIKRKDKLIYYTDPSFSIQRSPLSDKDLAYLEQALEILQAFPGLPHSDQLMPLLDRLRGANRARQLRGVAAKRAIAFDQNPDLHGLKWLGPVYTAVLDQQPLMLTYQAFGQDQSETFAVHPYFLKQYNQRWFLLCHDDKLGVFNILGLERILNIEPSIRPFRPNTDIDLEAYHRDVVGITRSPEDQPQRVLLEFSAQRAPYILTKPLHHSQRLAQHLPDGRAQVELWLIPNFEFRARLLSHAGAVRVLEPARLREDLADLHRQALEVNKGEK